MKHFMILILILIFSISTLLAETADKNVSTVNKDFSQTNQIRIVQPAENAHLPAVSATFVIGSVPPNGKLKINGNPVPVHPGGGFLTMVNLTPGNFQIKAELILDSVSYNLTRTVIVSEPEKPAPVSPLTIECVKPSQDKELHPGEDIEVFCKGSPGMKAFFKVKGVRGEFPMVESVTTPGNYMGVYRIGNRDRLKSSKIKVTLENDKHQKESRESDGTISLFPNNWPMMVQVAEPNVILRAGPALAPGDKAGYVMFPPEGTLLQVTGRIGDEYRIRLTKNKTVWVSSSQIKPLPAGALPARVVVGTISTVSNDNSVKIYLPLNRKIPFKIDSDIDGKYIDISLFGAFSNTDWINNPAIGIIKNVSWFQDDEETYRLRVDTMSNSWWGYDARYEGNTLVLELRTPPPVAAGSSSLAGLTIVLDAGHGVEGGATGPTGYHEGEANLAQVLVLKNKLLAKGAKVILTREGNDDIPLNERPKIAWQKRADILISIHNNALGYGGNPLIRHGFGVYYFTPMSLPLAREIHDGYIKRFSSGGEYNLPDDGLFYGNLALTRSHQMPCVLIESAYMIVPAEEAYLKTDGFRSACADAIISGLERYAGSMRRIIAK